MDPYTAAANSQQSQPPPHSQPPLQQRDSPRGVTLEDRPMNSHRRNNSHFGSHDDFYAFLDNNRGPSMAPVGTSVSSAGERSPPPAPMPPSQQQQQRNNAPTQSRPPVTNIFPERSRLSTGSYSGSRSEELLVDRNSSAKMARQNQRRGAPPTKQPPGPRQRTTSPTPPVSGGSSPTHLHSSRPVSGNGDRDSNGAPIPRLKSPSVLECVLQPLDQKIREYDQIMRREQEEVKRLDEELRILQERRAETEKRFGDAKAKHDEYQRQYTDVERAMSGELPMSPPREIQPLQRPATMAGPGSQQRPMSARRFGDDVDGEDDEDYEDFAAPPFGPGRRINSQQSFSRASQKTGKERFRFSSLFGGNR
ncbi:hypothetical protein RRF57_000713 [Xylaria bambusicola]|uniref:Uncharacterized protein n=1 Tax=Xylaria bambusicola TaxID=326684 RepID=A0AAN7Z0Y2_9PEZI